MSQAGSSDQRTSDEVNVLLGEGQIEVKPYVLNAQVAAGMFSSTRGDGMVGTLRIDAAKRYPIAFDGVRLIGNGASGADVELSPGIRVRLDASRLDTGGQKELRREAAITGATLLRGWICGTGMGGSLTACDSDRVSATADFAILRIGGRYTVNPILQIDQTGMEIEFARATGHFAAKIGGLQVDACAAAASGAVIGSTKVGKDSVENLSAVYADLSVCAGVDLRSMGVLREEFRAILTRAAFTQVDNFTNTLSLMHIGSRRSPVGIFWTYEKEQSEFGGKVVGEVKTHLFGLDFRF